MSDLESKSGGEFERKRRYEEEDSNSIDALADEPESTYVPLRERKKQLVNTDKSGCLDVQWVRFAK